MISSSCKIFLGSIIGQLYKILEGLFKPMQNYNIKKILVLIFYIVMPQKGDNFMLKKYFYPKISQSILLLAICLGLQLIVGIAIAIVLFSRNSYSDIYSVSLLLSPVCTALTVVWGVYRSKTSLKNYFTDKLDKKLDMVFYFLLFAGVYCISLILAGILESFIPANEDINSMFIQGFSSWIGILSIVVLAPIFEELLFRGVILRGFLKNYSATKSIIITAVLFGVLHLNPIQSIIAALLGLVLGWMFVKTGSLWVCIFFHALNNGFAILLYHLAAQYNISDSEVLFFIIPAVLLGALSFYILSRKPSRIAHILEERDRDIALRSMQETVQNSTIQDNNMYPPQGYIMPYTQIKHSNLGIASFIIAMVVGICDVGLLILTIVSTVVSQDTGIKAAVAFVLMLILGAILNLVGIGLGIGGALTKNRKQIFPILGIVFNSLAILVFVIIIAAGIYTGKTIPQGNYKFF